MAYDRSAHICHLLIYESGGLRCVNLSPSLSELNRQFKASTNNSLDGFCRSFLKEAGRYWDPAKASKCQVLLEGKMFSLVAVEGDRASKVVLLLQRDDMKSSEGDLEVSPHHSSISTWGTQVLPLLHRAIVTFLDYGFLILGERPNPSRGEDELLKWQTRKSDFSEHPPLPPLPCGVRDFEDAFALFDREGTGLLTQEKFKRGLQVLEVRLSKKERERLFRLIADGKDLIDYRHFLRFFTTDGSRESGPMALRAGLARAKSVSHFSTAANNLVKLEPTKTEKRIRGLERVLAILELHTGRYANNVEFNFTRSFILVNRKALSRYRRFVFRRLLSGSQKKPPCEYRRSKEWTAETDHSLGDKASDKCKSSESVTKERKSISISEDEILKLKERIKELEIELKKPRKRRNHTIDMGGVNTPMERVLQTNVRKLEKEKKDFDKKLRQVKEKGDLRRESLRKEIRRLKSEREHLRKELEDAKAKLKSSSKATKQQVEEEILWKVRNVVENNSTKLQTFESELAWKLSSTNNVIDYIAELRRVMNNRVRKAIKVSEELKKSKQKVKKLEVELADVKNSKSTLANEFLLIERASGRQKPRLKVDTNNHQLNETFVHTPPHRKNSPVPSRIVSPAHNENFLAPLGQQPNPWPEIEDETTTFYSPRAPSIKDVGRKKLKRNKSEPSLVSPFRAKWYASRNEAKGQNSLKSVTPHHTNSLSQGNVPTLERMERSCSPSLAYSGFSEDYVSNLETEMGRLKKLAMKARYDLEVSELQRDRYKAQIMELRRSIDIYRENKWQGGSTRRREVTYLRQRLDKSLVELENKDRQLRYLQSARESGLGIDLTPTPSMDVQNGRIPRETLRHILELSRAFVKFKRDYVNQVGGIKSDLKTFSRQFHMKMISG